MTSNSTTRAGSAGIGFAVASSAAFGTSGAFATSLFDTGWTPGAAVTVRILVAAAVLTLPALVLLRGRWAALRQRGVTVVLFGVFAVATAQVSFYNAVLYVPVGIALLLEYLGIVLVVAWQWVMRGERPGPLTATGAALAVGGLAVVLDIGSAGALDPVGVLWGLAAAVGLAGYFVISAELDDAVPPLAMVWAAMVTGGVALVVVGLTGVLPLAVSTSPVTLAGGQVSWVVPVLGVAVVAAAVPYVAGVAAARRLGARTASFVSLLEVVFAVGFAWLLLGQLPGPRQAAGGAVILAGVVLVRLADLMPRTGPSAGTRQTEQLQLSVPAS